MITEYPNFLTEEECNLLIGLGESGDLNFGATTGGKLGYRKAKVTWFKNNVELIDKIKLKYGYLSNIYTSSRAFPNRSNVQIKYLIDNSSNVLNLTKANINIFEVQNIFKSKESIEVSLFDYNPAIPQLQQLANNQNLLIWEGGYRYIPIYSNIANHTGPQYFSLSSPIAVSIPAQSGISPNDPIFDVRNYDPETYDHLLQSRDARAATAFGGGPAEDRADRQEFGKYARCDRGAHGQ